MDSVRGIVDGVKAATYEVTALLLPGAVLIAVSHALVGTPAPDSTPVWLIAAYSIGLPVQGVAGWISSTKGVRVLVGGTKSVASPAEQRAGDTVGDELGRDIADAHLLDVVLTRVHPNRHVYDKFLALADTARALALIAVFTFGLVVYANRADLLAKTPALMLAGIAFAWVGLCERYRRFKPLAYKALYGQFVALSGRTQNADAATLAVNEPQTME